MPPAPVAAPVTKGPVVAVPPVEPIVAAGPVAASNDVNTHIRAIFTKIQTQNPSVYSAIENLEKTNPTQYNIWINRFKSNFIPQLATIPIANRTNSAFTDLLAAAPEPLKTSLRTAQTLFSLEKGGKLLKKKRKLSKKRKVSKKRKSSKK